MHDHQHINWGTAIKWIIILLTTSTIAILTPYLVPQKLIKKITPTINSLGAGLLLGTLFFHILPEVAEQYISYHFRNDITCEVERGEFAHQVVEPLVTCFEWIVAGILFVLVLEQFVDFVGAYFTLKRSDDQDGNDDNNQAGFDSSSLLNGDDKDAILLNENSPLSSHSQEKMYPPLSISSARNSNENSPPLEKIITTTNQNQKPQIIPTASSCCDMNISDIPITNQSVCKRETIVNLDYHHIDQDQRETLTVHKVSYPDSSKCPPDCENIIAGKKIKETTTATFQYTNDDEQVGENASDPADHDRDHENQRKKSKISAVLLVFSISIHALFEGMAIVMQMTEDRKAFGIGASMVPHKFAMGSTMAFQILASDLTRNNGILVLLVWVLMTPLGMIIGGNIYGSLHETGLLNCLNAIALGTFFYVEFFEIAPHEFSHGHDTGMIVKSRKELKKIQRRKTKKLLMSLVLSFGVAISYWFSVMFPCSHDHAHGAGGHSHEHDIGNTVNKVLGKYVKMDDHQKFLKKLTEDYTKCKDKKEGEDKKTVEYQSCYNVENYAKSMSLIFDNNREWKNPAARTCLRESLQITNGTSVEEAEGQLAKREIFQTCFQDELYDYGNDQMLAADADYEWMKSLEDSPS